MRQSQANGHRRRGRVEWFRGTFGFIRPEDGGPDVFVHFTGIRGDESEHKVLQPFQQVEFGTIPGQKGPIAVDVEVVS